MNYRDTQPRGLWDGWYELEEDGTTRPVRPGESPSLRNIDHRRVAQSDIGEYWVSTVFLGLDHSYMGGPPLLFETMVFPSKRDLSDLLCWRYTTKQAAADGHAFLVTALEAGTSLDDIEQPDSAP